MPPTTSDRFFALAARIESALPDAGYTAEDAAELVGALRSYWETPTEQALEALKGTQERVLFAAARAGKVNRDHPVLSAHYALDRAAQVFFANEPEPFTGNDTADYLDKCEACLSHPPSTGARNFPCDPYPPPPWAKVATLDANQSTDAAERDPGIMAPWMPWNYDKTEPRQWAKPGAEEGTVEIGRQTFHAVMTWTPKETT